MLHICCVVAQHLHLVSPSFSLSLSLQSKIIVIIIARALFQHFCLIVAVLVWLLFRPCQAQGSTKIINARIVFRAINRLIIISTSQRDELDQARKSIGKTFGKEARITTTLVTQTCRFFVFIQLVNVQVTFSNQRASAGSLLWVETGMMFATLCRSSSRREAFLLCNVAWQWSFLARKLSLA